MNTDFVMISVLAAALAAPSIALCQTEVTPNTRFVQGSFAAYDPAAGYHTYGFQAFYEPTANGIRAQRIFLLPMISFSADSIEAEYPNGKRLDADDRTTEDVTVRIALGYRQETPSRTEKVGIVAAALGSPITRYVPPAPPVFSPAMNAQYMQLVQQGLQQYNGSLLQQMQAESAAGQYSFDLVTPQNLSIEVYQNNAVLTRISLSGYALPSGSLPILTLGTDVPLAYRDRARRGDLRDLVIRFSFRDASLASVQANFNAQQVITNYVRDFQQRVTRASSSGFDFFIISHRDTFVRDQLNMQLEQSLNDKRNSSTSILMDNATSAQVELFKQNFFPTTTLQQAIDDHLKAAEEAAKRNDTVLAKAHTDYADYLRNGDSRKGLDAMKAAAALATGDVLGFLAAGVRFSDSNYSGTTTYNRVVQTAMEQQESRRWNDVRTFDALRAVVLQPQRARTVTRGYAGLCANTTPVPLPLGPYGPMGQGVLVTCVAEGSPAANAGIQAGDIAASINGVPCTNGVNGGATQCLSELTDPQNIGTSMPLWFPLRNATTTITTEPGD